MSSLFSTVAPLAGALVITATLLAVVMPPIAAVVPLQLPHYVEERSPTVLQKVMTVESTGQVVVAGVNWLLRLDADLRLLDSDRTGPVNVTTNPTFSPAAAANAAAAAAADDDNNNNNKGSKVTNCSPPSASGSGSCSDNGASVLVAFPDKPLALYCGTARLGLCSVYSLQALRHKERLHANNPLNLIGNRLSTVAFFGHGNTMVDPRRASLASQKVLYLGSSYDGRPMALASRAVSARVVHQMSDQTYDISYLLDHGRDASSSKDIASSLKSSYLVRYVYGFEHRGFSYFLSVQKHLPYNDEYVTHLVRVCQNDVMFHSYTEIQLECRKMEYQATFYNIARAAYLGPAGEQLRRKYGFDEDEEVLYVAFGRSRSSSGSPDRAAPEYGSSVCMYPMSRVRTAFTKAQMECYSGRGEWPSWIVEGGLQTRCNVVGDTLRVPMNDTFCGRRENRAIAARFPLETVANITTRTLVTAIKVVTYKDKTVAVLGNNNGSVVKVMINGNNDPPYANVPLAGGLSKPHLVSDMAFSNDRKHVYALTANKVTKVPIESCRIHTDCATCVTTGDPLGCGWCKDRCSTASECMHPPWRNTSCPPVIHSFSPRSGPIEGGTRIEIIGANFGTKNMSIGLPDVQVALAKCNVTFFNWTHIVCLTQKMRVFASDIEVRVHDRTSRPFVEGTARSAPVEFSYWQVYIRSFSPKFGPESGGTLLTIRGEHLDIGSSRSVTVAGLPCDIKTVRSDLIECKTSPWQPLLHTHLARRHRRSPKMLGDVKVYVDNAVLTVRNERFEYASDPIITDVYPRESIHSGGLRITVRGDNLNTVVHPRMMAKVVGGSGRSFEGECSVQSDGDAMTCISPDLRQSEAAIAPGRSLSVDVYFLMDDVESLHKFPSTHPGLSRFKYYVDPTFTPFKNGHRTFYLDTQVLALWGDNMDSMDIQDEVKVLVGQKPCNVSKVGTTVLICKPERPAEDTDVDLSQLYPVQVTLGRLSVNVGKLQFAERQTYHLMKVVLPVLGAVLMVATILAVICCCRRRGACAKKKPINGEPASVRYIPPAHVETGATRENEEPRMPNENSYWFNTHHHATNPTTAVPEPALEEEPWCLMEDNVRLIPRDQLLLLEVIGQGHFGCVYRGFMTIEGSKEEIEVAVKTLKSLTDHHVTGQTYVTSLERRKFLDEARRMSQFDHPNILRLIGIVLDKEPMPLVVLPFMKHGDLLSFIRNEKNSPTVKQLMDFGIHIAEGMAHLASLKFVHRDLAARNCMLDDTMNVKVADFGLSRDIYERDYYSSGDPKAKLPVKWMAPESLEKGTYDSKTDVWSYGVVLWELMTRGVCPYPEVDNWDIIKFLNDGRRMPQPSYCPDALYAIMLQCWQTEPKLRPTFEELVRDVNSIILSMERAQEKVGLNVTYVNVPTSQAYLYPQSHAAAAGATGLPPLPHVYPALNGLAGAPEVAPATGGAAAAAAVAAAATSVSTLPAGAAPAITVGNHRLSYHTVPATANATSRSTLV